MKPSTQPFEAIKGIKGLTFLASFQIDAYIITPEEIQKAITALPRQKMELWAHTTYPFAFHMLFSIEQKALWNLMTLSLNEISKQYQWWTHCDLIINSEGFYKALDFVIQAPVKAGLTDHWLNWEDTFLSPDYP